MFENVFSIELDRGSYNWQIKCVDSEGNEGFSEVRDLRIKKRKSSSTRYYSDYEDLTSGSEEIIASIDNDKKEPEIIRLNSQLSEEKVIKLNSEKPKNIIQEFFEKIVNWFKWLFGLD